MDSKLSNTIRIGRVDVSLMAVKYVELYPRHLDCKDWKHFGLERTYPINHLCNMYFKILDKEKFLWAMVICGVEFEFVKDFDAICNEISPQNSFGWH